MRQLVLASALAFTLGSATPPPVMVAADGFDAPPLTIGRAEARSGVPLTVMSYNVRGLPWPVIEDRSAQLIAIGDRLAAMRRRGAAPQVVLLQEAFSDDARRIAGRAGYRYVADGPQAADDAPPFDETPLPERYWRRGEGFGAYLSSGLLLMSDYPIMASWRAAFPRTACAGYDCLANKGVLLARIAVPGLPFPVDIGTAHLNSRRPARTPMPHTNAAYLRQLAAIDRFLAAHSDPRLPLILTADLNLDSDRERIAGVQMSHARWVRPRRERGGELFAICGRPRLACRAGAGFAAIEPGKRNNDWQFYSSGRDLEIQPHDVALRFQPDPAGRTLSDHQALTVSYRISAPDSGRMQR